MGEAPTDDLLAAVTKAFKKPFGAILRLEPEGLAPLWVDGRRDTVAVAPAPPGEADCAWRASKETLIRIFEGERLLVSSFVSGRLIVSGDMSVMARLQLERGA